MSEDHADVNNAPLWRQEVSERLLTVERGFSEIKSDNAAIKQSLTDVIASIRQLGQDQRFDRKPFQWSVAIAFATLVLGIMGVATTLALVPIREQIASNTASLATLKEADISTAKWQGKYDGLWEERTKRLEDHLREFEQMHQKFYQNDKTDAYLFGRMESLQDVVRDIDMAGSRKWVKPNPAVAP
ncbi:MAG: hypothetical protein D4R57_01545 [Verrucomicrobiales bacterium]|nr:MAG: hypothetical protein D4R57_01545 [Verrucomicrobiales bacterium]